MINFKLLGRVNMHLMRTFSSVLSLLYFILMVFVCSDFFNMCRHCIVAEKIKIKNTFLFNLRLSGNDATSVLCNVCRKPVKPASGVQIAWDICERFGCYLYSTE